MAARFTSGTSRRAGLLPVLLAAFIAVPAGALEARPDPRFDPGPPALGMREPSRAQAEKSPDRIVRDIEKKYGARVVRQQTRERNGRRVLVLRLDDGRKVWKVEVDAETGREL